MAKVTESHPQGWCFERARGLKRDWVPEIFEKDKLEFAIGKSELYDFTTIFYEVSYCAERGFFYALGPKFLNFRDLVLPMKARYSCDGKKTYKPLACQEQPPWLGFGNSNIIMDAPDVPFGVVHLELELANGDVKEFEIVNQKQDHKDIVINTMQKDNEIGWVIDWVNYYRSLGVVNFDIYDNNSENVHDLIAEIKEKIPNDTNVKITHWPYKYGLHHFHTSLFSQRASILDGLYQSSSADWFINCDIDEYFIIGEKNQNIQAYLKTFEPDIGCVQFSCSETFLTKGRDYGQSISIRDFEWRRIQLKIKYKNACRPADTRTASVHYVHLVKGSNRNSPTNPEAIYLHALNLATGWQSPTRAKLRVNLKNGDFVKDRRVIERMERINNFPNKAGLS